MAARLRARRSTGGKVEILLLEPGPGVVSAMAKPAKKLKLGDVLTLNGGGEITVAETVNADGIMRFELDRPVPEVMAAQGELPLPPYMNRAAAAADTERYQTVFAGPLGAAAAPTAGLHFTPEIIDALRERGVGFKTVTLHVGIGTFRPLRPEDIERGELHREHYVVSDHVVDAIAETRERGGRVIAVGTTALRTLESATRAGERIPVAGASSTTLFIQPGYELRTVDGLITNFHLPRSSLLMLVASLVGRERLLAAYQEAITQNYRFYSYGDAMLIL